MEIGRVSRGKKLSSRVAQAESVKESASHFGAIEVIIGEAVEWQNADFHQTVPDCSLPWGELRSVNYLFLNPEIMIHSPVCHPSLFS